jgi:hypothetical protein
MPKRIWLLILAYMIALPCIVTWSFTTGELGSGSGVVLLTYLTFALPLGIWGAFGKSRLLFRLLGCAVPGTLVAVGLGGLPLILMLIESSFTMLWHELTFNVASAMVPQVLFYNAVLLSPTILGAVVGLVARWRGLRWVIPDSPTCSTERTQHSLRHVLGITTVACVLLGLQPALARAASLGVPESAPEAAALEEEPSQFEYFSAYACQFVAVGTPFILVSLISCWMLLFLEEPWRRAVWGVPLMLLSGTLLFFHYGAMGAYFWMVVFGIAQCIVLAIVRSTGYRLVWPQPVTDGDLVRQIA